MVSYVFLRYEMKYRLTTQQYLTVKAEIERRLSPDAFGETTIQSLYYDTPDNRLVRASLEKPIFKEKLRLRCYGLNNCNKDVFLEMKRKCNGVVYKRRISCKESTVKNLSTGIFPASQIGSELEYFLQLYPDLSPKILILYDRAAYFDPKSDLRVTFDRAVRYRTHDLNFTASLEGEPLLEDGTVLMELKTGGGLPLWLCQLLSNEKIVKSSFSKYGAAYENEYRKNQNDRSIPLCSSQLSLNPNLLQPASSPC